MQIIEEFSDERLKNWCIHCGGWLVNLDSNLDHAPSKSFLQDPRPENLPTVPACRPCNNGFSKDEAYMVACLSAVMSGTTDPGKQIIPSARRILEKSEPLQAAIKRSSGYTTIGGERRLVWKPDLERIERVVVKNARGHAFFEITEPMMHKPASVRIVPVEYMTTEDRADFENAGSDSGLLPGVGSRLMTRVFTGQDLTDHGWVLVQEGVYRHVVDRDDDRAQRPVWLPRDRGALGRRLSPSPPWAQSAHPRLEDRDGVGVRDQKDQSARKAAEVFSTSDL